MGVVLSLLRGGRNQEPCERCRRHGGLGGESRRDKRLGLAETSHAGTNRIGFEGTLSAARPIRTAPLFHPTG
ncbi:hypothetical protein CBM2589_B10248 [Cupriavidus taiwanensis]|uniref:Uncharacterized protein n=1 Tax=Cupriavidus taiwanensis TaxID=164546 RepID=A0A975ZVB4_9BURK|nr:hypothetical protein CBM2589_B10248 [Cupriavidus taiwanensis]